MTLTVVGVIGDLESGTKEPGGALAKQKASGQNLSLSFLEGNREGYGGSDTSRVRHRLGLY